MTRPHCECQHDLSPIRFQRDRQCLPNQLNRPFRVGAMLARPRAAARMVRDFDQREFGNAEKFRLGPRQFHEDRLAERHRRLSLLL